MVLENLSGPVEDTAPPRRLPLGGGRSVWVLEDASAQTVRVLGTEPRLHAGTCESIAATIVLKRHPLPEERHVRHLVSAVKLTLDLDLTVDETTVRAVAAELGCPVQVATVRTGTVTLGTSGRDVLLTAHPSVTGRTFLGGTIGGADASKIVDGLLGSCDIPISFDVKVVTAPSTRRIQISGRWIDIWERLAQNGMVVNQREFEAAVQQLLNDERINVAGIPSEPVEEITLAVAEMLWQHRIMLGSTLEPNDLQLRERPYPLDEFSFVEAKLIGKVATLTGCVSLQTLMESGNCPIGKIIDLVVADESSGSLIPVVRQYAARERRAEMVQPISVRNEGIFTPGVLIAAPIHRPAITDVIGVRPSLDYLVADLFQTEPGPLVNSVAAKDWPDHKNKRRRWYAPSPKLIDKSNSDQTFFVLHKEGITREGEPALRAVISVPFDLHDPNPGQSQNRRAVAMQDMTVDLELPFRDEAKGNELRRHRVRGEIFQGSGHQIAQFQVLNAWTRIAYRALSNEEAESARLVISYRFWGYEQTRVTIPPAKTFGATLLKPDVISGLMLDATNLRVSHPIGHFKLNPRLAWNGKPPKMFTAQFQKSMRTDSKIARRLFSRVEKTEVMRSCTDHPNSYVEQQKEGVATIGCQPAFQLGKVVYRQFREIRLLRANRYRVYQSQTDAGRYLVVPTTYRVGRTPNDETDRAYRPLSVLHAAVGVEADDVEVLLEVGLQPDLRPIDRLNLEVALHKIDPRAQLMWPTEVPNAAVKISWTAADTLAQRLTSTTLPDGTIHFSAGLDVQGWMVLRGVLAKSGLAGVARFDFPDGSSALSTLEIDLRRVIGPWGTGPIAISVTGQQLTLRNPTASEISVALVAAYRTEGVIDSIPVGQVISSGSSITIPWSVPSEAQLVTDHEIVVGDPVTIEEIRSFMEEIEVTSVILNQAETDEEYIVEARIQDYEPLRRIIVQSDEPAVEVTFPLPLSAVLSKPTLVYRTERNSISGPWRTHRLSDSAFITITKDDFL